MHTFEIPLGPGIEEPHIIDEIATTENTFVTECGAEFERGRRIQSQEVEDLAEIDEPICSNCENHL